MSYYKFKDNIYIVHGAKKHCIYDLNKGNLYNITQRTLNLIYQLLDKDNYQLQLNNHELGILNQLNNAEIIVPTNNKEKVIDILSLRTNQPLGFSWIEVTRQCNLSCSFCYEKSNPYCIEKMCLEDFHHVCNELKDVGIKNIQFIGGEPLILKNKLKEMIKYSRYDFDCIEVYTNGTLINEDWSKFFADYNIALALSIHSYIPEEHDRLTKVKDSHKKALKGLDLLKKYKIQYRIGTVGNTNCNVGEKTAGIDYTLRPKEPKVTGLMDLSQYNLEMFEKKAITKKTFSYSINKSAVITNLSGHKCFIKDLYISTQLEVFPCVMERRISHGNLKNKKLAEIINDKIRFLSKDNIEECKDCEFRYACFDCRPDSNGKGIYQKPWYCTYEPREGKWRNITEIWNNLFDNLVERNH